MGSEKLLPVNQQKELIQVLKDRFNKNMGRHKDLIWSEIEVKLASNTKKLWSLSEMERTGGEPDVVGFDETTGEYIFYDCSVESPAGRRSLCYDQQALEKRKQNKPKGSAEGMAAQMGVEMLTEQQYRKLQQIGNFDAKTSSWVKSPSEIRKLGGAIFCDYRFGRVFTYHNGAESYYSGRAFRSALKL
jgi:hypothetical protein